MNKHPCTPNGWASSLSVLLKACYGADHFPVDVISVAQDYSRQVFPNDPIAIIRGEELPGFEGKKKVTADRRMRSHTNPGGYDHAKALRRPPATP